MDDSDRLSVLHEQLKRRLGIQRYDLWLGSHNSLSISGGKIRVGCDSQFEMQWLRRQLQKTLLECSQQLWDRRLDVEFFVQQSQEHENPHPSAPPAPGHPTCRESAAGNSLTMPGSKARDDSCQANVAVRTRPRCQTPTPPAAKTNRFAFSNFVAGKGNELAYRTAQAVVRQPGQYGPLLLFGPAGVGKTHLAYAMVQQLRGHGSRTRAVRLTAEQFTTEFLEALDRRTLPGFRQKYRSIDVLVVDDVQFLAGKAATLEEMLHTIDTLHERGRQVVLTSDRSPGELQKISLELVSRISGGIAIPMEQPDYETRLGIVRQLLARRHHLLGNLPMEEIASLVAGLVAGSARQLSGAINRLIVACQTEQRPMSVELARSTLTEYIQQNTPAVRLGDIQRAVCEVFGVEPANLKSKRKSKTLAQPRMLAMWLARKYTHAALGEISHYFGRSSHSTVISAQKKVETLVSRGAEISLADRPCHVEEAIRRVESILRTA